MNKKLCIINAENQIITDKLKEYGYTCIATEKSANVSDPISLHADVLYLKTGNKEIYVSDCQTDNIKLLKELRYNVTKIKLAPGYKTECKLNMIVGNNIIVCNPKTCINIERLAADKEIIAVKQGYAKCSTIVLSNNDFITEDRGIYDVLKSSGKNCLLIEKGKVSLAGYEYGFIGGASVYLTDENTLLFLGDITEHPNYKQIIDFCDNINIKIDYIKKQKLIDIGGAILLN